MVTVQFVDCHRLYITYHATCTMYHVQTETPCASGFSVLSVHIPFIVIIAITIGIVFVIVIIVIINIFCPMGIV